MYMRALLSASSLGAVPHYCNEATYEAMLTGKEKKRRGAQKRELSIQHGEYNSGPYEDPPPPCRVGNFGIRENSFLWKTFAWLPLRNTEGEHVGYMVTCYVAAHYEGQRRKGEVCCRKSLRTKLDPRAENRLKWWCVEALRDRGISTMLAHKKLRHDGPKGGLPSLRELNEFPVPEWHTETVRKRRRTC